MSNFTETLRNNLLSCPTKSATGMDCPGCGIQRAFVYLLEGDISSSVLAYPALIPIIGMVIYLGLHLKFQFKNGSKVLITLFSINTIIILTNWLIKLF